MPEPRSYLSHPWLLYLSKSLPNPLNLLLQHLLNLLILCVIAVFRLVQASTTPGWTLQFPHIHSLLGLLQHIFHTMAQVIVSNTRWISLFCLKFTHRLHTQALTFFLLCSAGVWTQDLLLKPLRRPIFCDGFFEIGSRELFAWPGFKLWSSWSLPPE
jgi:hypothetical protein